MPVVISMLRGVNLAGHNRIKMDALRALYESLKLQDCQTYVQSGNVVFRIDWPAGAKVAKNHLEELGTRIENAIEQRFGFRPDVILRTASELLEVIARNPFAKRRGIDPRKLLVAFLAHHPGPEACNKLRALKIDPEELHIDGRELYIYFPNGIARAKLSWPVLDRTLKTPLTGRNWNTVMKLAEIAEHLGSS
jgi:uncharacterized protein (DUF1697 family)